LYDQEVAVKPPRFSIAWLVVAVAIAAVNFGAIRTLLGPRAGNAGAFLLLGALPMANALIVGMLIARQRPRRRPFVLGFEVFGALALSVYVLLSFIPGRPEPIISYLDLVFNHLPSFDSGYPPPVLAAIRVFVAVLLLVGPQLVFALIGGFISRRFKITITRR
jgi:hypothetical protein